MLMDFSVQNSARRIVQEPTKWKSRQLDLGNRHRTTLNFADLIPAYWTHVMPGDKLKMDATILAKFLPLIAPAFSRIKIKSEWFYVPLKQISPVAVRAIQDFKPTDAATLFSNLLQTGNYNFVASASADQQVNFIEGFPSIPAWWLSSWFAGTTATTYRVSSSYNSVWNSQSYAFNGSVGLVHWRTQSTINSPSKVVTDLGYEDFVCFASKNRCRKLLNYLGLPKRLTTMRYTSDVIPVSSTVVGTQQTYLNAVFNDGSPANVDTLDDLSYPLINDVYKQLTFGAFDFSSDASGNVGNTFTSYPALNAYLSADVTNASSSIVELSNLKSQTFPAVTSMSSALISLLPMMAYQKIFNDFYRDEKLQSEEVRVYPYAVYSAGQLINGLDSSTLVNTPRAERILDNDVRFAAPAYSSITRVFNNLFMLRRRNRAKDVLTSCVTDKVLVNRLAGTSTAPNVFQSNLFAKVEKYLMKKEFTGSTWAEWLNNFFGEKSNDYLNNNVVFLGQKESIVSISENIQTSESSTKAAQGNRAGLAGDFHAGDSIYFRVPDFGVVMCVVSVIPDDADNFNGLQERFCKSSPFDFNLPDFQNIGFAPVFNRRANVGYIDNANFIPEPSIVGLSKWYGNDVFGYQPFGYEHTYVPNLITGDFQTESLRFWHQSPDLDYDFTDFGLPQPLDIANSWANNQLRLNANLPAIGMRLQPLSANLSAQYYNNIFAETSDESGDHIVSDMRFFVTCHRNTAFFTDAVGCDQ